MDPEKLLVNNCSQFLDIFEKACKELKVEVEQAMRKLNQVYPRLRRIQCLISRAVTTTIRGHHIGIDRIPTEGYFEREC